MITTAIPQELLIQNLNDAIFDKRSIPLHLAVACADIQDSWNSCQNAKQMVQLLAFVDPSAGTLAACACVRTSTHFLPAEDPRPLRVVEAGEAWASGTLEFDRLSDAVTAAHSAAVEYCRRRRTRGIDPAYYAICAHHGVCYVCAERGGSVSCISYAATALTGTHLHDEDDRFFALADVVRSVVPVAPTINAILAEMAP